MQQFFMNALSGKSYSKEVEFVHELILFLQSKCRSKAVILEEKLRLVIPATNAGSVRNFFSKISNLLQKIIA